MILALVLIAVLVIGSLLVVVLSLCVCAGRAQAALQGELASKLQQRERRRSVAIRRQSRQRLSIN